MAFAGKSHCFVADLPLLEDEQLGKLYTWGKSTCLNFDVHMKEDGLVLVAKRKKEGTARDHMRLLRTNLQNWGVVGLPAKQTGWLRIVPAEEVAKAMADGDQEPETSEQTDLGKEEAGSETNVSPPGTPPRASTGSPPKGTGVYLPLPPCLLNPLTA